MIHRPILIAIIRGSGLTIALIAALTSFTGAGLAYSAQQKSACMADAFRLCSDEIPNIPAIAACMRRQKADLSPACKAVFDDRVDIAGQTAAR